MRRLSKKREVLEREYRKALKAKLEDHEGGCEGCGRNIPCTPSHLIPRGYDITLLADPENFHLHCEKCAQKTEAGEYPALLDGRVIYEYIERTRPEYLRIKEMAYEGRYGITYSQAVWVG